MPALRTADAVAGGYVSCPAGYKVFTGGAFWWRNSPDEFLIGDPTLTLNGSTPTFDGNGWYADGLNFNDAVDANLRVIARCLPEGRLDKVKLRKETVGVSSSGPVDRRVACPDGTRIISGGAFWHYPGAAPDWTSAFDRLASSGPTSATCLVRGGRDAGRPTPVDRGGPLPRERQVERVQAPRRPKHAAKWCALVRHSRVRRQPPRRADRRLLPQAGKAPEAGTG